MMRVSAPHLTCWLSLLLCWTLNLPSQIPEKVIVTLDGVGKEGNLCLHFGQLGWQHQVQYNQLTHACLCCWPG